jgi:hypothetical protein
VPFIDETKKTIRDFLNVVTNKIQEGCRFALPQGQSAKYRGLARRDSDCRTGEYTQRFERC